MIANFQKNNLHLVSYSEPFVGVMGLDKLKPHLHTRPDLPDAIPYVTSYYKRDWGFCLSHNEMLALPDGDYNVVVDTEFRDGHLDIGEAVLPGKPAYGSILLSSYLCHPSMANDQLSGPLVMAGVYEAIKEWKLKYTYRFALFPETIGSLAYLSLRRPIHPIAAGFHLVCLGNDSHIKYRETFTGDTLADRVAGAVFTKSYARLPYDPTKGSDERQFCSPGFRLPVVTVMKAVPGGYPQYHTSLDCKGYVTASDILASINSIIPLIATLERNAEWGYPRRTEPHGEPQLGKHDLYPHDGPNPKALMWVLALADGKHDVLQMAERSGQPIAAIIHALAQCREKGLI